jgi:hypothetical protein
MRSLQLPKLSPQAAPDFIDAASAKTWLENVPLANVAAAQHQLLLQLEEFNLFDVMPSDRLAALEAVREAVHFVEIEQARRFTNRALPMMDSENAIFSETLTLWEQMRVGYLRCLEAVLAGDAGLKGQTALVCQRVLGYEGLKMFHHYRAYREVPPSQWRALHESFVCAEELGVADEPVKDYLNRDVNETSPRVAYIRALMLGLASPSELSQRQLTFVAFLLERWADKVDIGTSVPEDEEGPPLVLNLQGDQCPERGAAEEGEVRYLDVKRLAKSLRNRIGLLRKGESPAKLALGQDCVQPSCEQLLVYLYRQWCQGKPARAVERKRASDIVQVSNDPQAIHYYVSGRVFKQPGEQKELTSAQRDQIAAFGRVSTRDEDDYSVVHGYVLEEWRLKDESSQGLKMTRKPEGPGKRYAHGQLLGLRTADSKSFMLGQVRWMVQNDEGALYAGVRLLPGLPAATAVRAVGLNVVDAKYVQALSLTGVPALNAPPSLVLPTGWYKPKRVVEVYFEGHVKVRLLELLERGTDYERVSYEMVA